MHIGSDRLVLAEISTTGAFLQVDVIPRKRGESGDAEVSRVLEVACDVLYRVIDHAVVMVTCAQDMEL